MIIATAGHVDHGKTSLVNALTGVNTDRLEEEQARGLTIDLGFAYADAETGGRLGFVDVPGHIRFINNMLAGVSAIDHALLVVAADDGVMPQTIEHLEILKLLGIRSGTIAVTKIDRCDETQIIDTLDQIEAAVAGSFLANAEVFNVSSITDEGIETLRIALDVLSDEVAERSANGYFRLSIDRRFTVRGAGIVVTGSVFSGDVSVGDELRLMPQNIAVRVRGLHTQNEESETATAGDRCAVNLTSNELALEDIHRGNWLTNNPLPPSDRIDVSLDVLSGESRPFSHWTPVHIHTAANHVTGRAAVLENSRIEPGKSGLVQLVLDEPINVCIGDRFVIRDQTANRTLGGGVILDTHSPKRGRARPERIALLNTVIPDSIEDTLLQQIPDSETGIDLSLLMQKFNTAESPEIIDEATLLDEQILISDQQFEQRSQQLQNALDRWHEANPTKSGLPINQLSRLVSRWTKPLTEAVVRHLITQGALEQNGNQFNRPGAGIQLTDKEQKIWQQVESILESDPGKPPVVHELASTLKTDPKPLDKTLGQLVKAGLLIKPVKNRYFTPSGISVLKQYLAEAAADGNFSVQQYRDIAGIGRNLSIEILEYFDRQGITRRIGDERQLMKKE